MQDNEKKENEMWTRSKREDRNSVTYFPLMIESLFIILPIQILYLSLSYNILSSLSLFSVTYKSSIPKSIDDRE